MAILVAYDGSRPAQEAVEHAVAEYGDRELVLLRVVEVASGMTDAGLNLAQEELDASKEELSPDVTDELVALLDEEDVSYRVETVVGEPAREIVSFAEDDDIEYIVIGSHGRKGVSRLLFGSVAETVVRRAPMPVVVVR